MVVYASMRFLCFIKIQIHLFHNGPPKTKTIGASIIQMNSICETIKLNESWWPIMMMVMPAMWNEITSRIRGVVQPMQTIYLPTSNVTN